jgi:hypothetical protein
MRWWDGTRWTEHIADWQGPRLPPRRAQAGPSVWARLDAERRLTPWLRGLLVVWPLATAASTALLAASFDEVLDVVRGAGDQSTASGWSALGQLAGALGLALLVVRMLWLFRAAHTAQELGLPARRNPWPAAISWLIPILNFWWPYQAVTDLFPAYRRPDRRIAWWWGTSVAAYITPLAAVPMSFVPLGVAAVLLLVAMAPVVAAAVLEIGIVADVVAVHTDLAGP